MRALEEQDPLNHLSRTHRGSQGLDQLSWSLHGSVLGPLHMLWLLRVELLSWAISHSFASSGTPFLLLVTLSNLAMRDIV